MRKSNLTVITLLAFLVLAASSLLAQNPVTALDAYDCIGRMVSDPVTQAWFQRMGGVDSIHKGESWVARDYYCFPNGMEVEVIQDSLVQSVILDMKKYHGRLPFGLSADTKEKDLFHLFPHLSKQEGNWYCDLSSGNFIDVDPAHRLTRFTFIAPGGYIITRPIHFGGIDLQAYRVQATESALDTEQALLAMEMGLLASLNQSMEITRRMLLERAKRSTAPLEARQPRLDACKYRKHHLVIPVADKSTIAVKLRRKELKEVKANLGQARLVYIQYFFLATMDYPDPPFAVSLAVNGKEYQINLAFK